MANISVFDIFKIGIGPSSSHTMGPWRAALDLLNHIDLSEIKEIEVRLFGSLAKTGIGHGTDLAVVMGLSGYDPITADTAELLSTFERIKAEGSLRLGGVKSLPFGVEKHIKFVKRFLKRHPNGLRFLVKGKNEPKEFTYYSVGGGFIESDEHPIESEADNYFPYPINTEADLRKHLNATGFSIAQLVWKNELSIRTENEIKNGLMEIWQTMRQSIYNGCHTPGTLPGGLKLNRRAYSLHQKLSTVSHQLPLEDWLKLVSSVKPSFTDTTRWVSCFALAVNEENAAFGRVVTAPTNGAAGVIPAVLMYYLSFCDSHPDDLFTFLLTAAEIGSLYKKGSTISAAMGGCQAEIGVSSSMAAGALTACLGGTPHQALVAAEIAMEHHLGLTCDPINGLVQIPCIERNTMGAIKAITASQLALSDDQNTSKVSLDGIIKTMWATAQDMHRKYKETSEGGLAKHISIMLPEC